MTNDVQNENLIPFTAIEKAIADLHKTDPMDKFFNVLTTGMFIFLTCAFIFFCYQFVKEVRHPTDVSTVGQQEVVSQVNQNK